MGFYNGDNTSVNAILTTLGRKYLSTEGRVNITRFQLSDEEIDYTLYDDSHPDGTDSFGLVLENIIPLEASPTVNGFKSYLVDEDKFSEKKLVVPPDPILDADTLFTIKPETLARVDTVILEAKFLPPLRPILDNPDTKDVDESGGSIGENAVRFETYDADIDGPKNPETYLFTIENLKIINFENNEGETQFNPLQEKTYRGKQITVKALRVNPGATTTVTVRGEKSNLKKVIVVKVNEDKTFDNLSPFNENAVVTDSTYY
tara:strand:+ start:89 stop:871 length:783 start_codon:yes stop_codon:yes gene_type:complete